MGDDVQDLGVGRMFWTMCGGADCSLGVLIRGRQRGLGRYRRERQGDSNAETVCGGVGAPQNLGKGSGGVGAPQNLRKGKRTLP